MSKNCSWPDCENTVIHGDTEAMTEFGEMCPYHKAMITIHNRIPPKTNANASKF
jgi:hypothetical protein